jgi:protocatechuate 3,4-dioxygenase beta subunit
MDRRQALQLGLLGLSTLLGCTTTTTITDPVTGTCTVIPTETAGPYPADGSNASSQSLNVLTRSGIVRSDIRSSLNTGNVAAGVPLTIELTLVDSSASCAPLSGYAIYAWHCTQGGLYSMYSNGVTAEDYLRGVQATDSNGKATFTSVFPGCYSGRWPHIHFEVYPSLATATSAANKVATSQLALPQAACDTVYATTGYSSSVGNLAKITLASDNVFSDGSTLQLATITGDTTNGFTAKLQIAI